MTRLLLPTTAALALLTLSAAAEETEFRFDPPGSPAAVYLSGDFNNWNPAGHVMRDDDGDGVFSASVDLPPGRYQYKFVVGDSWYEDPDAAQNTPDGFGGRNSVVIVGASDEDGGFVGGGAAPAPASPGGGATGAGAVKFTWTPDPNVSSANVAGEFNDWSTSATPMADDDGDGTWEATLDLTAGKYAYKFVGDGGNWFEDPNAAESVDDGFGGKNSVITVGAGGGRGAGAAGTAAPASPGGGATGAGAVKFTWTPDPKVSSANLAGEFNDWSTSATPMADDDGDGTWEATLDLAAGRYAYKFVGDGGNWFEDPNAAESVDDGFGGKNSVIAVGAGGRGGGGGGGAAAGTPAPARPTADSIDVTFRYTPVISGISSCNLAGEFNGWDQSATPLSDDDGDGTWEVTLPLAPGKYAYKFVVDSNTWLEDPNAADSVDDGFGGQNSVVTVGARTGATAGKPRRVRFAYRPSSVPDELSLAGTFNNWTVGKTLLHDDDGDGEYTVSLLLPEDTYQYKFVADGEWITDRSANDFTDDGFGGENSIVVVDDSFPGVELEKGDGRIFTEALTHRQTTGELNRVSDTELEFTVKTYQNDVEHVRIGWDRGLGTEGGSLELAPVASDATYLYWRGVLALDGAIPDLRYEILYRDGDTEIVQDRGGSFFDAGDRGVEGEGMFAYSESVFPRFTTPDWVRDGVFYQIFPERFANGDTSNDPDFSQEYYSGRTELPAGGKTNGEYFHLVTDWYDTAGLVKSPYRTDGLPDYYSFYGGDIAGVRQNLDYLEDLGVTILYFNPLFQARSNHKYEAYDYMSVDPSFGTPEELRAFVDEAHARGIRVVVDWVINHIGDSSPYFQDTVEKGEKSPYWNWFEWHKWPLPSSPPDDWTRYYACWWGFAHMPELNFDLSRPASAEQTASDIRDAEVNQPVVDYVLASARWWLEELDIDGFRLDVANEVPFWMWKLFRQEVRRVKPDAYLVGEIWSDAGEWVSASCFDATMNYKYFKDPVTDFLGAGRIDASRFDRALQAGRMAYPAQATRVMMNLVDSHDTVRYLTVVGDERRQRLTALFEMTYIGAPHIYYGDEIAMKGGKDPDCRRPFRWNWQDDENRVRMHDWYRRLIALRKANPALVTGDFRMLVARGPLYVFARTDGAGTFVVAMNVADREIDVNIPLSGLDPALTSAAFEDLTGDAGTLGATQGNLQLTLGAVSGSVMRLVSSS